jgi:hypothetical protein
MESVERDLEAIEDGHTVVPEPFGNLQLMARMGQMAYLRDRDLGAPEEILEALRQYTVLAAHMLAGAAANQNAGAGPPGSAALPPGAGTSPMPTQPEAALSPQAMMLRAG